MVDGTGKLPSGWAWARLGEVCDLIGGVTVDAKRTGADFVEVPYLRVANVQRGRICTRQMKTIRIPQNRANQLRLAKGDVLLNEGGDRDKVGRGWVWESQVEDCVFQNHIFRARPRTPEVNPFYLSHYLNEIGRAFFLAEAKQTTNLASLSLSKVAEAPIMLAPAAEQARIVTEVKGLFVDLDEAEAALARARAGLKDYRASLLHAACTGQLTAAWRASRLPPAEDGPILLHRILAERRVAWERAELARLLARGKPMPAEERWKARYPEPVQPESVGLPLLPSGWTWATVDQLTEFRGNGLSRRPTDAPDGHPILRVSAVRSMRVNTKVQRLYTPAFDENVYNGTAQNGDLLFTRYSGSEHFVGVCGLLRDGGPILYPDKLMAARPHASVESLGPLIELMAAGGSSKAHIAANIRTTAGQKGIAGSSVRVCPIPLPSPCELRELVKETTALLEDVGVQEAVLVEAADQLATLRQSILHAAFAGRLVPQNPADEPAAALLARLRADPAAPRRPHKQARAA